MLIVDTRYTQCCMPLLPCCCPVVVALQCNNSVATAIPLAAALCRMDHLQQLITISIPHMGLCVFTGASLGIQTSSMGSFVSPRTLEFWAYKGPQTSIPSLDITLGSNAAVGHLLWQCCTRLGRGDADHVLEAAVDASPNAALPNLQHVAALLCSPCGLLSSL
jgi:hypothetical protein